jgi:magnesium transporter
MRQFKVNDELINKIKKLIKGNDNEKLIMNLNELHYADLAEIFELLEIKEVVFLVKIFDKQRIADALAEIDEDLRELILENLSAKEIA